MGQFRDSQYFTFDGISSESFNLMLLDVNEDGLKSQFGTDRTIEEDENNIGHTPLFVRVKQNSANITMELIKCGNDMTPIPFLSREKSLIKKWLFKSNYKPLIVGDLTYHVIFDKVGILWENANNQGYITLNAHVQDGFAHSSDCYLNVFVEGTKTETIKNISDVDLPTYLKMKIVQFSETNEDIIVENISNGDKITIKNIAVDEEIIVYGDFMEIYSITNPTHNVFNDAVYNNNSITIRYGKNILKCTGNFQVIFTYDLLMQL